MFFIGRLYFTWVLIAALALPQLSLADPPPFSHPSENTAAEGFLIPVGQSGDYLAIAAITDAQATAAIQDLTQNSPDTTVFAVSGTEDSVARILARQPRANETHITQSDRIEEIPAVESLPRGMKQKLLDKLHDLRQRSSYEKINLMISYLSAAIASGTYFFASGDYVGAGGMLGVLTAFNTYISFFQGSWDRFKRFGRDGLVGLAEFLARKTGAPFTEKNRETLGMYGEFNMTWAINSSTIATILALTSSWSNFSVQTAIQALVTGFVANVDVWDYSIRRIGQGLEVGAKLLQKFVLFRLVMVEILTLLANWNMLPEARLIFGMITISGLMWLLAGEKAERKIADRLRRQSNSLSRCKEFLKVRKRSER